MGASPGLVSVEIAKVYRGGGRRWFTKRAAANAEAWRRVNAKHCECEVGESIEPGSPGYTCWMHRDESEGARIRRVVHRYAQTLLRHLDYGDRR